MRDVELNLKTMRFSSQNDQVQVVVLDVAMVLLAHQTSWIQFIQHIP